MALPASGEISIGSIYNELTGAYPGAYSDRSINACEAGTYGAINQNSAFKPNGTTPNSFAEWYGYDHSAGGGKSTEVINLMGDETSVWVELSATETLDIKVYGYYYNINADQTPFWVTVSAGTTTSNIYYDPFYFAMTPEFNYIKIGTTTYYSSPSEGPTHFWEWY